MLGWVKLSRIQSTEDVHMLCLQALTLLFTCLMQENVSHILNSIIWQWHVKQKKIKVLRIPRASNGARLLRVKSKIRLKMEL